MIYQSQTIVKVNNLPACSFGFSTSSSLLPSQLYSSTSLASEPYIRYISPTVKLSLVASVHPFLTFSICSKSSLFTLLMTTVSVWKKSVPHYIKNSLVQFTEMGSSGFSSGSLDSDSWRSKDCSDRIVLTASWTASASKVSGSDSK